MATNNDFDKSCDCVADVVTTVSLGWKILCQRVADGIVTVADVVSLKLLVIVIL